MNYRWTNHYNFYRKAVVDMNNSRISSSDQLNGQQNIVQSQVSKL